MSAPSPLQLHMCAHDAFSFTYHVAAHFPLKPSCAYVGGPARPRWKVKLRETTYM